jgi:parallel beta-helix repeat protein
VIKNNKYAGIDLRKSHNNRIISNNLTSNQGHGIRLYESGSNTLKGNNVEKSKEKGIALSKSWSNKIISNWIRSNNGRGIHIEGSDNNNVTGNNVSFNSYYGIEFSGNNHVLADNIVNSNGWSGIKIVASNSILRNNTINSNSGWGIYMHAASYNTLLNNSINDNKRNFGVGTSHHDWDKHFNHSIDTSNTVNGKPIYYIVNEKDKIYDETTNAGYFAAVFCENITIKNLNNLTNNSEAVLFRKTHHSHIVNIFGMLNSYGINLMHSDNNTVSNSNLSTNSEHGLYMWYSSGDEIRNCNISSNDKHGVYIYSSNNNRMDSCIISSNEEHGVYINDHSNNNRIDNCVISSNKERGVSGVTIDGWTYNCELNNNSISLNNDYGIYIRAGGSNKIFNNTVNSKKEGIYFRDGTNNILINNNVTSDSYPLYFSNVDSVAQDIDTTNTLNDFKTIALSGVNNVTVTNFSLVMPEKIKVTNFGIINLANCKNVSIENVTIVNHSANGIFVYKSSDNVIANCTLNSNDRGIYLYKSEPCDILNNTLNNNRIGVRYNSEDLYHCNIKGNEMNSNLEHGIYIVGCCGSSGETSISDNIMSYNGKWGIYISRTGGNVLINNNTLNSNEDGIYVIP